MMLHRVPSAAAYPPIDFYASPIRYVGLPHVSLAHRQANHEGDWKHVSRELKTDWGKSRRTEGQGCCAVVERTRMDGGILVVGERGIA